MHFALFFLTIIGHVFLWIGILNRLHATALRRRLMDTLTILCLTSISVVPVIALLWWLAGGQDTAGKIGRESVSHPGWIAFFLYGLFCWIAGAATIVRWIWFRYLRPQTDLLRFHRRRSVEVTPSAAALSAEEHEHDVTVRLPGNQSLKLELTERAFEVPKLPKGLDGLTIVHISDLHFTGKVGKAYFREVVRISNELKPDLIAITGDLVDNSECINWIPDTIGKMTSRYGIYFVLGNHDLRVDESDLRRTAVESGLIDVGGRWVGIEVQGESSIIAGNELPWYSPAADFENCPPPSPGRGQLRIVLSHCPDQLDWARANGADLMLSGHTHGGQIRIPLVGPIFSPTASGVKYDHGLFHVPPTILHVTRGISGKLPLRWNCPPEIAILTLHSPAEKSGQ
jgi:uncharacterized protein